MKPKEYQKIFERAFFTINKGAGAMSFKVYGNPGDTAIYTYVIPYSSAKKIFRVGKATDNIFDYFMVEFTATVAADFTLSNYIIRLRDGVTTGD
jgi:hypothetical protein